MCQLWWEAARKQFYLCRIFYPGLSWTYFYPGLGRGQFFCDRHGGKIWPGYPHLCSVRIFHFSFCKHVSHSGTECGRLCCDKHQYSADVICDSGEVDCMHSWQCCWCIGDPKLGKLRELPKLALQQKLHFFGENSQIYFLSKLRSSCCSNCTTISLEQFKSHCLNCIMRIAQV